MSKKNYFVFSILIMLLSLFGTFYFAYNNQITLSIISILLFVIGTLMLIHWSTISYNWECSKCKNIIELNIWSNIKGMNIEINQKFLFCSKCNKKVTFNGIKKY